MASPFACPQAFQYRDASWSQVIALCGGVLKWSGVFQDSAFRGRKIVTLGKNLFQLIHFNQLFNPQFKGVMIGDTIIVDHGFPGYQFAQ